MFTCMHGCDFAAHERKKTHPLAPIFLEKACFSGHFARGEGNRKTTDKEAGLGGLYLVGTGTSCVGKTCA